MRFLAIAMFVLFSACSSGGGGAAPEAEDATTRRGMVPLPSLPADGGSVEFDVGSTPDGAVGTPDAGQTMPDAGQSIADAVLSRDAAFVLDMRAPDRMPDALSPAACLLKAYEDLSRKNECVAHVIGSLCGSIIFNGECGWRGGGAYGKCITGSDECCYGCVDAQGRCRAGIEEGACGSGGVACESCSGTRRCVQKNYASDPPRPYLYPNTECR
jgi:hypothetical protein